jgi:hypothetical protein
MGGDFKECDPMIPPPSPSVHLLSGMKMIVLFNDDSTESNAET